TGLPGGPMADGSNQLRLYDAGSPLLPSGLSARNVAMRNGAAQSGAWHASLDAQGQVWMWVEGAEAVESDEETAGGHASATMQGLPPSDTLALGGGHALVLTHDGEVWTWEMPPGAYPSGADPPRPPAKLAGLPEIVSIGAWREYGFAKSADGAIWLWQGIENKYAALSDEELAAAIGILTGNTPPQDTPQTVPAPKAASMLMHSAMMQTSAASASEPPAPPTDGLRLWLKADAGVETDANGKISEWADQSGLNNHATQTNANNRPEVVAGALNGLSVVKFDAAKSQRLSLPNYLMNGAEAGEAFVVLKAASATPSAGRSLWLMGSYGNNFSNYYPYTNGTLADYFGAGTQRSLGAPVADITQWHVYNVSSKAGEWVARLNGAAQHRAATNTVYWPAAPLLGGNGSNAFFDGGIAEVLVFDKVLSAAERATMQDYLVGRHRLAGTSVPPAPSGLAASVVSDSQVALTWDKTENPWITYEIERRWPSGGLSVIMAVGAKTAFLDGGLDGAESYAWRVRAVSVEGAGPWSEAVEASLLSGGDFDGDLEGLRLWLRPGDLPAAGESVESWPDASGQDNDAVAPAAGNQPEVTEGVAQSKAVSFAAGRYLALPNVMSGATAGELFVVARAERKSGVSAGAWQWGGNNGNYCTYPYQSGIVWDEFGTAGTHQVPVGAVDLTHWHVYNVSSQTGEWVARFDGEEHYRSSSNTVAFRGNPLFGAKSFSGGLELAEVLVVDRVLSATERERVTLQLSSKYGLAGGGGGPPELSGFEAEASGGNAVDLSWDVSSGAIYQLERKGADEAAFVLLAYLPAGSAGYRDGPLQPGTGWTYRLRAVANGMASSPAYASVTLPDGPDDPQPPGPPSGLTATAASSSSITLAWTASPTSGATYELKRKLGDADSAATYAKVDDLAAGSTSYTDTGLDSSTTYTYRLHAVKNGLYSSSAVEATATTKLTTPDDFIAEATAWNTIILSWTPVSETGATYELERKLVSTGTGTGGDFENVASLQASGLTEREGFEYFELENGTASYANTGLSPETGYTYRLRAVLDGNTSDYTDEETATTPPQPSQPPGPPSGLTATAASSSAITLAWTASPTTGATYELKRKLGAADSAATYAKIDDLAAGSTSYTDTGLDSATTYTYRLHAVK
ncbi:MAG: fibronectin type III domain-containing protein, partial [Opitutaceae bacterium]|nr:fibronectin type III domain-containing protein [Opitutaceae bacterium]